MKTLGLLPIKEPLQSITAEHVKLEIGDTKQSDFQPQVKLMGWSNEVNLSIRSVDVTGGQVAEEDGKVKYRTSSKEVHLYGIDSSEQHSEGGFEFEVWLLERPATNVLEFSLHSKTLLAIHQPELTAEELAFGYFRPENVIGSYALFHAEQQGNFAYSNYRAGKIGHIFRPEAIDAKGHRTWCELLINGDLLTVTVPQKFLDNATFPVLVDPTFGYQTAGASTLTRVDDDYAFSLWTTPADIATASKLSVYGKTQSAGTFKAMINLHSDLSLIGSTNAVAFTAGLPPTAPGWKEAPFGAALTLTPATDYIIGCVNDTSAVNTLYFDAGSSNQGHVGNQAGLYATPAAITSPTHNTNKFSIYATYAGATRPRVFGYVKDEHVAIYDSHRNGGLYLFDASTGEFQFAAGVARYNKDLSYGPENYAGHSSGNLSINSGFLGWGHHLSTAEFATTTYNAQFIAIDRVPDWKSVISAPCTQDGYKSVTTGFNDTSAFLQLHVSGDSGASEVYARFSATGSSTVAIPNLSAIESARIMLTHPGYEGTGTDNDGITEDITVTPGVSAFTTIPTSGNYASITWTDGTPVTLYAGRLLQFIDITTILQTLVNAGAITVLLFHLKFAGDAGLLEDIDFLSFDYPFNPDPTQDWRHEPRLLVTFSAP